MTPLFRHPAAQHHLIRNAIGLLTPLFLLLTFSAAAQNTPADDPTPPQTPVKLIFIHHSTGANWLAEYDPSGYGGGLGRLLMKNNYFVSTTHYGWGPNGIGDRTDIPDWPEWFVGPESETYLAALYTESTTSADDAGMWPRLDEDPGGENEIIMFKSCFPNSNLEGSPDDAPADEGDYSYSVAGAKAVYNALLPYFASRQDKLFVVITAPPLAEYDTTPELAANARAFNNWLMEDWLAEYPHANVAVFDFYNVLTSSAGSPNENDLGAEDGNHHRWSDADGVVHMQTLLNDFSAYYTDDSHPSGAGGQKAAEEFVPLLNVFYHRWQASLAE